MDSFLAGLKAALVGFLALFGAAPQDTVYFGYVEGDYLYMAARQDGYIDRMVVADGDIVAAGGMLFALDDSRQADALAEARATLDARKAELADKAYGARSEEIAVIEAKRRQAAANLALARATYKRTAELVKRNTLSESRLDEDQATLNEAEAALSQYEAEIAAARLPAREDQSEMLRRAVDAASAGVSQAETDLAERRLYAPVAARVDRVFLYPGEFARAGSPVVSLLPPDKVKVRFFVPAAAFAGIRLGDRIEVGCSGCERPVPAAVTRLSSEAEFTPPVIFSREERDKLIHAVEAVPDDPDALHPGQAVDIRLLP